MARWRRRCTLEKRTTLRATVDFDKRGKPIGFIQVPLFVVHDDAWGVIRVPIAVISNGSGPTVVLEGGNHGDEYEGPIVLGELIRTLDPGAVSGRLIFIPAINLPAVAAARRTSPLDDLNFNRAFSRRPSCGSPTLTDCRVRQRRSVSPGRRLSRSAFGRLVACYHSQRHHRAGGRSRAACAQQGCDACFRRADDRRHRQPRRSTHGDRLAARAGLTVVGTGDGGRRNSFDRRLGLMSTCAGCATSLPLAHLGVLPPEIADPPKPASPVYDLPGPNAYVLATDEGVFEPYHANGTAVRTGQAAGRIHFLVDPSRPPVELAYRPMASPMAAASQAARPGNCCLVVARPLCQSPDQQRLRERRLAADLPRQLALDLGQKPAFARSAIDTVAQHATPKHARLGAQRPHSPNRIDSIHTAMLVRNQRRRKPLFGYACVML